MNEKKGHTDFLFAKPSFLSGVARVLDLFGTFDSTTLADHRKRLTKER